jgi:hypothetical protein
MDSRSNIRGNIRQILSAPGRHRRRALELLAASRDGCAEALMLAHGFTVKQMVELVRAGRDRAG